MDVADVSIESLESRLLRSPTPKLGSLMVSGVVGSEIENESLPVSGCFAVPGMQCKILSMLVDMVVVSLLTGVLLLEESQQCGSPRSSRDQNSIPSPDRNTNAVSGPGFGNLSGVNVGGRG